MPAGSRMNPVALKLSQPDDAERAGRAAISALREVTRLVREQGTP
ncbi:hypothetical protein [Streptomyces sp. SP18BB07]|nr:hypothetical protein [Streptomyces sp. SP18BB07]MEE1758896.1 hypothetical protein [Streptomyces sp. SP18BB07]